MKETLIHAVIAVAVMMASASLRAGNLSDYRFHSLPETSYYGGVHSIAKDSIGRIWFSGSDAVYLYDGIAFNRCNEKLISDAPDVCSKVNFPHFRLEKGTT